MITGIDQDTFWFIASSFAVPYYYHIKNGN